MNELKWAMVGTGFMAELILKDFALADNTSLAALVSRSPEKAEARLAEFGIEARALTFEQAIADAEIDVIYIATPHSEHFGMAKAALEAGKHVLVEKAFTMSSDEARELALMAKANNRFLMEAMWTKFLPLHKAVKMMIEKRELGDLVMVEANFGFNAPFDADHRLFNHELGGGSTLDHGVYTTTLCRWYADAPIKRQVSFGKRFENGADSHADTTFEFENGVIGHGISSLVSMLGVSARVIGTNKSIDILGAFWNSRELNILTFEGKPEPLVEHIAYETKGAGYAHMLEAVSAAILDGKLECEEHPLSFTIANMEALDEIRSQIQQ